MEIRDYREIPAGVQFDKIVSVGMVEHVGRANLPQYFGQAYRLLRPGGLFLNHGIVDLGYISNTPHDDRPAKPKRALRLAASLVASRRSKEFGEKRRVPRRRLLKPGYGNTERRRLREREWEFRASTTPDAAHWYRLEAHPCGGKVRRRGYVPNWRIIWRADHGFVVGAKL